MAGNYVLGIDIGGSGIKGAPVDLDKGDFAAERLRIDTPQPATPEAVAAVVKQIVDHFADAVDADAPVGITFPAPVLHGVIPSVANLDQSWAGVNADELFTKTCGRPVVVVNDGDAAGVAEVHYGAAKDHPGIVMVTTLGTGIGTALIYRGVLVPNTELGHIEIDGKDAETRAAASVKENKDLSYKVWAKRLQKYYATLERLFSPDLFVVGGGVSKDAEKFLPRLDLTTPIVAAQLQNRAGIVGAAWYARDAVLNPPAPIQGAGAPSEVPDAGPAQSPAATPAKKPAKTVANRLPKKQTPKVLPSADSPTPTAKKAAPAKKQQPKTTTAAKQKTVAKKAATKATAARKTAEKSAAKKAATKRAAKK